jgi:hypothetical protein
MAVDPWPSSIDEGDAAGLLQTIVGELLVVDQRLKLLSGKTKSAELLLARRFVAMAAEQAAVIVEKRALASGTPEMTSDLADRLAHSNG